MSDFQEQLQSIEHDLLEMASRAEMMVSRGVSSLVTGNVIEAKEVIQSDDRVDLIDLRIEQACLSLLTTAGLEHEELRGVATILKIITDVERVADLGADIAKCALRLEPGNPIVESVDIPRIAGLAQKMFHMAIESFVRRTDASFEAVEEVEREIDRLFAEFRQQIHERMQRDPENVIALSGVLFAVADIERIADHALNISERVSYLVTGEVRTHSRMTG